MAVAFEALLRDAMRHGGVAFSSRAFAERTRERRAFHTQITRPLRAVDFTLVHLIVDQRVVAAIALTRRPRSGRFQAADQRALASLVPPLAVGDALLQTKGVASHGLTTTLECVDGRLTRRQKQVVEHVALGHSNAEIGEALGISAHTVRNLLVSVRRRLDASNRAEVVHRAVFR